MFGRKEKLEPTLELGQKAKDKVTGFEGILSGYAFYLYGCGQYLITAKVTDPGAEPKSYWFDEGRIEILGDGIKAEEVKAEKNGGPNSCAPCGRL